MKSVALYFVVLATLLLIPQSPKAVEVTPRIVGGSTVPDNRYPFMASIFFDASGDGTFFPGCGGSIVGSRWVLTAAHCLVDAETLEVRSVDQVLVRVGALDISDETQGEFIGVRSVHVHPSYNAVTSTADLALLELPTSADSPVLALPVVGGAVPLVDEIATVAGWGTTSEGGFISNDLQEVDLPIVAHAACLPVYRGQLRSDANVCAGGSRAGGMDSCQGDSGGPLFVVRDDLFVQAGIVSYGEGCARPNIPGVYTRLTTYVDWVASFVDDAVFAGSVSNVDPVDQTLDDLDVVSLTAATPSQAGRLEEGNIATFEVTGGDRVDLTSLAGDADLFVFQGANFESEDATCVSELPTPLDSCDLPDTSARLFAVVYGFSDSSYEVEVFGDAESTQNTITADFTDPAAPVTTTVANDDIIASIDDDELGVYRFFGLWITGLARFATDADGSQSASCCYACEA